MMKRSKRRKEFNYLAFIPFVLGAVVIMLTLGYSASIAGIAIDGATVVVQPQRDVRIISVSVSSVTGNAVSNSLSYDKDSMSAEIVIPAKASSVTYEVQIRNMCGEEMALVGITRSNTNLDYTFSNYVMRDKLCDDIDYRKCTLGSITTVYMTVGWQNDNMPSGASSTQRTFIKSFISIFRHC